MHSVKASTLLNGSHLKAHMRDIHNLVEKVVDAKARNPSARVPAIDRVFNFHKRLRNQIPEVKTTEHTVVVTKAAVR
ncbi:hypothetical protein [Parasitella parasitica]|uniref:Uncharacterized protein n=1 Tax=Parasitella parasitica TaxID=35722 RepID=A0A0B7N5Z5_9FUNG|nr:hypothetical protein [Parasitella parasitica]